MRQYLSFLLIGGFAIGVLARSFLNAGIFYIFFFAFLSLVFTLLAIILKSSRRYLIIFSLLFFSFALGVLRYEIKDQQNISSALADRTGQKVAIMGVVDDEPDEREQNTRIIVKANQVFVDGDWLDVSGDRVLVYVNRYPELNYGDILRLEGELARPENFSQDFDWEGYLAKDDIFLEMFYPDVKITDSGKGSFVKNQLFALKKNFVYGISQILPEPHASFLGGLTVGAKKSMPEKLQEDFRRVGVVHLVVLSGYNISIIADGAFRLISFLPIPYLINIIFSAMLVVGFAVMTGASATIVRASIMAILVLLARSTGRVYEVTMALLLAGFLMLVHNPKILRFDPSFQLSFLATLGLIYIAPRVEKYMNFLPNFWGIRGHATATVSAQLAVTPLILHMMGNLSVVALPVNLLILMFVPMTMFSGLLTWIAGLINYSLSLPLAWISWLLLEYELRVVDIFSSFSWAAVSVSHFSAMASILIYGALIYLLLRSHFKKDKSLADEFEIIEIK